MNKKLTIASVIAAIVVMPTFAVDDPVSGDKRTTSQPYVEAQIETTQIKIPAANPSNTNIGNTVITYTNVEGGGVIGERELFTGGEYDADSDSGKLITAGALNNTFTNLPTTDTTKLECANPSDGCTLWTITNQTAYGEITLPAGYTLLDSITVDGAWFVTNLHPTLDTDFEIDFQKSTDALNWLFGTRDYVDGAGVNKFSVQAFSTTSNSIWVQIDSTSRLEYGTVAVTSGQSDRLARHRIRLYQGKVYLDGTQVNWGNYIPDTSAFTSVNPLVIGNNYAQTGGFSASPFRGTIYSATGFKPCLRNYDNVAGLWDVKNGVFIEKTGNGTVVAGSVVQ